MKETITVWSAGSQIRHGIYRDFPTRYKDRLGNNYVVDFQWNGALRDGSAEISRVEDYFNGKRIYLGDRNSIVAKGEHTYEISYATNRQLGFSGTTISSIGTSPATAGVFQSIARLRRLGCPLR